MLYGWEQQLDSSACIATVLRNSIRYGNLDILEDGYGINMLPLATFAMEVYKDDPCNAFEMKGTSNYNALEKELGQKMHKAIAIIQFKLEGQLIRRHKEFHMENRCLLHRIDPEKGTDHTSGRKRISNAGYRISDD